MSDALDPPDLNASDLDQALESPALSGTVQLAQAALTSPPPPAEAEAKSRRQVQTLMQEAALSPRVLREAAGDSGSRSWWERLRFWKR
ncbi:MAG: hypothetical protein M3Y13_00225 [Armatimonadota bacterium]|nr:hypothetical protein [Armatimonadota bacterium]